MENPRLFFVPRCGRWCYWVEKRIVYLTVCVSSFLPSRLVSFHEIATDLNNPLVPTLCMVKAMRHTSFLALCMCLPLRRTAGISRGLHRLILCIICPLRGPNDETTSPGPCVHEVAFYLLTTHVVSFSELPFLGTSQHNLRESMSASVNYGPEGQILGGTMT